MPRTSRAARLESVPETVVTPWVLGKADDEASRRCDFYGRWFAAGMTKGSGRAAYRQAGDAGDLPGDKDDDATYDQKMDKAVAAIRATAPIEWRRSER